VGGITGPGSTMWTCGNLGPGPRWAGSRGCGGPPAYTEKLGGYEQMLHKHVGLGITDEQRFRFVSLMSLAADDAEMPADP
jgi:hypothetical protein